MGLAVGTWAPPTLRTLPLAGLGCEIHGGWSHRSLCIRSHQLERGYWAVLIKAKHLPGATCPSCHVARWSHGTELTGCWVCLQDTRVSTVKSTQMSVPAAPAFTMATAWIRSTSSTASVPPVRGSLLCIPYSIPGAGYLPGQCRAPKVGSIRCRASALQQCGMLTAKLCLGWHPHMWSRLGIFLPFQ